MSDDTSFATGSILSRGFSSKCKHLEVDFNALKQLRQKPTYMELYPFAFDLPAPSKEAPEIKLRRSLIQRLESALDAYVTLSTIAPNRYPDNGTGFGIFLREIMYG